MFKRHFELNINNFELNINNFELLISYISMTKEVFETKCSKTNKNAL